VENPDFERARHPSLRDSDELTNFPRPQDRALSRAWCTAMLGLSRRLLWIDSVEKL
jgi:hypothetical protein